MWQQLLPGLRMMLVLTVLTGLIYPLAVTGLCQVLFRDKANGSLITVNDQVVGSALIGQNFSKARYFQPRPSAAGNDGYDGTAQVDRVARARRLSVDQIRTLLDAHTEGRDLGFLGEPRVNVLLLNMDLDRQFPARR